MTPEEYGQRLAAKDLEIRLLHTAIDKSNEALEAAVETQEERDRYKAALEEIIADYDYGNGGAAPTIARNALQKTNERKD